MENSIGAALDYAIYALLDPKARKAARLLAQLVVPQLALPDGVRESRTQGCRSGEDRRAERRGAARLPGAARH